MVRTARYAAMPFRSEPDEAAVGAVFGTLSCAGSGGLYPIDADAEILGHHLRHIDVEPLPHLRAAVFTCTEPSVKTCTSAPAWLSCFRVNAIPNLTGVSAIPLRSVAPHVLRSALALNCVIARRRAAIRWCDRACERFG